MKVAVLGLGAMGAPIARRLQAAGHELAVYNRTPGPEAEFRARGARVGETPAAAAAGADICVSMLADGAAVEDVLLGDAARGARAASSHGDGPEPARGARAASPHGDGPEPARGAGA